MLVGTFSQQAPSPWLWNFREPSFKALFYRVHFSFRGPSPHPRPRHRADRLRGAAGLRQHGVQPARRHQVDRGRRPAVRNSERGAKIFHDKAKIFGTPREVCLESDFLCNQLVMEQATSPLWLINCRAYLNTRVPNKFWHQYHIDTENSFTNFLRSNQGPSLMLMLHVKSPTQLLPVTSGQHSMSTEL